MNNKILVNGLQVDESLLNLINNEILPVTNLNQESFWNNFENIINEFTPQNKELLNKRDDFQKKIDKWHKENQFNTKFYLRRLAGRFMAKKPKIYSTSPKKTP